MPDQESAGRHPLIAAVLPLVRRVNGRIVAAEEMEDTDVPLRWDGETVAAVRLSGAEAPGGAGLAALLDDVAAELGGPLATLPRQDKQRAVRLLEERGAFHFRRSAETVAEALGVTRFTVYNYLNRARS
ncbi:helix-turn-helix domain-containing protein [Saccharomonospora xinjiangensis]|uniref:Transcriptional regulator DauR-like HTH domain-containing protein n=1 Tax=Saccharomonospora xinjiangensis XJ-54 TaxID=882086 RepID=I0V895_9PSEU|nr:helix-turn-helix domain-containing protein [Saccharomonospora xinjiangensis]EID56348.1 hypothetical protein SacxiDRAFT_4164 [Saccharomonospora xinjiangensis XJ-54]